MKNALLILSVVFLSANASAFSDIGTSKKNCDSARNDAKIIAQTHCFSLDTESKIKFGSCKKRNGEYRVPVYYNCLVGSVSFEYE